MNAHVDPADLATKFDAHHAEVKDLITKAAGKVSDVDARLFEIEQKMVRRGDGGDGPSQKSIGRIVTESDQFKTFVANNMTGKQRIEVKSLISSDSASAGALVAPDRQTDVSVLPRRKLAVRDLLDPRRTTSNSIEFLRQLARTNNAATVAEGALKPESAMTFEDATAAVRTIAHWVPVTKQAYADAPQLAAIIEGELMYGLKYVEDNQLLNGSGTGTDLQGMYTIATAFSAPITMVAPTKIDVLRLGVLQASLAGYPATGIVMHPTDWATIELMKDTTGRSCWATRPCGRPDKPFGIFLWSTRRRCRSTSSFVAHSVWLLSSLTAKTRLF